MDEELLKQRQELLDALAEAYKIIDGLQHIRQPLRDWFYRMSKLLPKYGVKI